VKPGGHTVASDCIGPPELVKVLALWGFNTIESPDLWGNPKLNSGGGATVVNDLVFASVITGKILALDRATGEIVWEYQAPGGINGWPAVAGDKLIIPVGFGDPPVLLALGLP
jgi:outer membrane protein assembly factor BamB